MATASRFFTFQDTLDHLLDFLKADPSKEALRDCRSAIDDALREVLGRHNWSFLYSQGRVTSVQQYTTGTIAYTEATRTVTLSGGTWPAWAAYGVLVLGTVRYDVASRDTNSTLTITHSSTPGADIAAGQTYTIYRDTFPMPIDFVRADDFINIGQTLELSYIHPRDWLSKQRITFQPSRPCYYTFRGDPNYYGQMACSFYPPPDDAYQFEFIYLRKARQLTLENYNTGKAEVTADSQTLSGTGTTWTNKMIGSVIRLASDGLTLPTGRRGMNPYAYERVITDVSNTASITMDATIPETLGRVRYVISDPVDIEEQSMLRPFLRCCEYHLAVSRRMKDMGAIRDTYQKELLLGMEMDSRLLSRRSAGETRGFPYRLAHMPAGPDIE